MKIKEGARLLGVQPVMILAAITADSIWKDLGAKDGVVITSGIDGKHSSGSLHYKGYALDLRIWNLPNPELAQNAAQALREALGEDFDVVLEKDHIHVEFDPKRSYEG